MLLREASTSLLHGHLCLKVYIYIYIYSFQGSQMIHERGENSAEQVILFPERWRSFRILFVFRAVEPWIIQIDLLAHK